MDGKRVILAAHRGDRVNFPENTIPAFRSAIEFGVDMIETDIRMTLDGELVLIHDRSALRTAGVDKNIDEMTLEEVKKLDTGSVFPAEVGFVPVPTVREFMELIKDTEVLVNWEFKVCPTLFGDEVAFSVADKLVSLIEEYGLEKRSMMNSFSSRLLEYVYKKYPDKFVFHGQGIHGCRRSYDEPLLEEKELFDWCCLYPDVKGERALDYKSNFDYCKENGIIPCICIKDTFDDYKLAIEYGCRMFTSNDIFEADRILRELSVR